MKSLCKSEPFRYPKNMIFKIFHFSVGATRGMPKWYSYRWFPGREFTTIPTN